MGVGNGRSRTWWFRTPDLMRSSSESKPAVSAILTLVVAPIPMEWAFLSHLTPESWAMKVHYIHTLSQLMNAKN